MPQKIGIALAAYRPDPGHFLEQLKSIQAQTWTNWVCCICSDTLLGEIRSDSRFAPYFADPRFQWAENPQRLGHLKNFEKAIQTALANGADAIACCDQDDIWFPEKLAVSAKALAPLGELGLVFCDMKIMNAAGVISERTAWTVERRGVSHCGTFDLLIRNVIPGTGMLMGAELVRRYPIIPEKAIYHDHWYPLVASRIGKILPLHTPLYAYRIHETNVAGLTPFKGVFTHSSGESVVEKCRSVWRRSQGLAEAVESQGLRLSFWERVAFVSSWDLGLLLLLNGVIRLARDPALARASWARAAGKVFDCLPFSRVSANH
jgi:hypothetical protein